MLLIIALSWPQQLRKEKQISVYLQEKAAAPQIEITIEGAVNYPGSYAFSPGITLKEALKEAELLKTADRKQLSMQRVLLTSQTIQVPEKPKRPRKKKGEEDKKVGQRQAQGQRLDRKVRARKG